MELELILIIACIVLAAIASYQSIRAYRFKKEVGNQEFLVEAKDDIIRSLNGDKKMLKAQIDAGSAKRKEFEDQVSEQKASIESLNSYITSKEAKIIELEDQVSMLVSQINSTGVRRGAGGKFVKVN